MAVPVFSDESDPNGEYAHDGMGLLDTNMPTAYGEGLIIAISRLQRQIAHKSLIKASLYDTYITDA